MKIALLTPTYSSFSGIDRIVQQKVKKYTAEGHTVTVFALSADMKPACELVVAGMPKRPLLQRIYRLLFFLDFAKISGLTRKMKEYDLIISFFYPMNIIATKAKQKYGIKYVYYNAGVAYPRLFGILERTYLQLFNTLTNITIKNCDEAYSISKFLADQLYTETGIQSKIEHVQIDHERFNTRIPSTKIAETKKKYGLTDKKVILYVGRISPHKGIHLLIESFNKVKKKMPDTALLIVGKHTFEKYSKELKRISREGVIFAGYVPDEELAGFYGACDVYATASLWEGFDIPCVEAQACGKHAVAFDVGSHKEVVKKGKLVPEGDTDALANALIEELQ